jgi:small subunit ribosomal protein S21
MLIVKVKDGEKIERALKRWKNKVRNTKQLKELRERKEFKKKSVKRRDQINKAKHVQKLKDQENS